MDDKITIHCLWLNFSKKEDGIINDQIEFFLDRIKFLHQGPKYVINFISRWDKLMSQIDGEQWLIDLIDNPYVGAAHKSDAIRYYLLYKNGGIWIDISTFLVTSLDIYNPDIFTCYFIRVETCISWVIAFLGNLYEKISAVEINLLNDIINNIVTLKDEYKKFKYVPENYFIISKRGNPICTHVYNQLKTFWSSANNKINSGDNYCYEINKLIWSLITDLFDVKFKAIISDFLDNNPENYKQLFDCAYLFNYLQLLKALVETCKSPTFSVIDLMDVGSSNSLLYINDNNIKKYRNELCKYNSCKLINIKCADGLKVNLLPASYNRLSKWSNSRADRLSWENTYAGKLITNNTLKPHEIINKLELAGVTQLKFGALTRTSPIIVKLYELFNNEKYVLKQPSKLFKPNNTVRAGSSTRNSSRKKKEGSGSSRFKSSKKTSSRKKQQLKISIV
jgi:hypothetical protein